MDWFGCQSTSRAVSESPPRVELGRSTFSQCNSKLTVMSARKVWIIMLTKNNHYINKILNHLKLKLRCMYFNYCLRPCSHCHSHRIRPTWMQSSASGELLIFLAGGFRLPKSRWRPQIHFGRHSVYLDQTWIIFERSYLLS